MPESSREDDYDDEDDREFDEGLAPPPPPVDPAVAYRDALRACDPALLRAIAARLGQTRVAPNAAALAADIAEALSDARSTAKLISELPHEERLALTVCSLTEAPAWPAQGLFHALGCLGLNGPEVVTSLINLGLVALELPPAAPRAWPGRPFDLDDLKETLRPHPTVLAATRTVRPESGVLPRSGPVKSVRETDGLEPVLRAAVVWQRVVTAPLRQTQQGTFYKRDRERLEDDPAVAGPIADALEPLPDMPAFWLNLSRGVGLLEVKPGSERVSAAPPAFWAENAFHLPQMLSAKWLGLWAWHEQGGMQQDNAEVLLALPFTRAAVLLWLATLEPEEWVATQDLAEFLRERSPRWDRPAFQGDIAFDSPEQPPAAGAPRPKAKPRARDEPPKAPEAALEAMLLGAAYQFNIVRVAEEAETGRRVVQLSALGRYVLSFGPPPPPKPAFDAFLYVQPNFEIIAYRQGLNPLLIGRFSRFALWTQVGAALALKLTPESVYSGLEGGMSPDTMSELLGRHNPRPLPAGVNEALRSWAGRREQVSYHASATLVEFASPAELEQALAVWPVVPERPGPARVGDRILLVEDDRSIPFDKFRLTGSRDYRKPPEACVEVEADGVTLTLNTSRSDLLVDAELARFTEEVAPEHQPHQGASGALARSQPHRRFVITAGSLARAAEAGMNGSLLTSWFPKRTGGEIPPSVRLMQLAAASRVPPLTTGRPLILRTSSAEVLDGLAQHPDTGRYLGERLGPTAVMVPDTVLPAFREALRKLGLALNDGPLDER